MDIDLQNIPQLKCTISYNPAPNRLAEIRNDIQRDRRPGGLDFDFNGSDSNLFSTQSRKGRKEDQSNLDSCVREDDMEENMLITRHVFIFCPSFPIPIGNPVSDLALDSWV